MGFSSTYSNGGQDATYTAGFGGGGSGGGGGFSLSGQMEGMGNFDPSTWINALREDQRNIANNRMFNELAMMQRRRSYDEAQAEKARRTQGFERQRANLEAQKRQAAMELAQRQAERAPLRQFDNALDYMNNMEGPLDRPTSGAMRASPFRNAVGASYLSGVGGGFPNEWIDTYKAAAGVNAGTSAAGAAQANAINKYSRGGK